MAKMDKKWIALCTTAIGAIYAAGYYITEPEANALLAQSVPLQQKAQILHTEPDASTQAPLTTPVEKTAQLPKTTPAHSVQALQPSTSSQPLPSAVPTPTAKQTAQAKSTYKDGTFEGTGSNRRGSIQVAVTIKSNKIIDVEISHFAMHYSESDVVGLPKEVVQRQSAEVDNVSGATYSTRAFQDAIQAALSLAMNAK
ncbi:FMN-binding protein [Paenibacillus roseipurpureus]|uniref:FMN-binding protein n=1 Tax=Paenibacillus roseopurpureus TaxID=2918901 RepID=A0AA96RIV7_9BACL|nr:FMN-binding protein [Paenibacillus sp. MBLB1832]WNR42501.1 FMN-binding protein [Paenibacillus sp. MBLB1832]